MKQTDKKNDNEYILLHFSEKMVSIKELMDKQHIYGMNPDELFEENREHIWSQYTDYDKMLEKEATGKYPKSANDLTVNSWLPSPCTIKVSPYKITAETAISQTNILIDNDDFYSFAADKIQDIYQNEGFVKLDSARKIPDCTVLGWFKANHLFWERDGVFTRSDKKSTDLRNRLMNMSGDVISLNTQVSSNGGSFSIRLPIIPIWTSSLNAKSANANVDDTHIHFSSYRTDMNIDRNAVSRSAFIDVHSNYYSNLISSNDLIFISFETLQMELNESSDYKFSFGSVVGERVVNANVDVASKVFDMIGLVDEVRVVTNAAIADAYVEVTGRDLMKLLIEDGSFFFHASTSSDPSSIFANDQGYNKQGDIREAKGAWGDKGTADPIKRLRRMGGEIDVFANRLNKRIDFILKAVISQLANIEVAPSYVFEEWGDDRTTFSDLEPAEEEKK